MLGVLERLLLAAGSLVEQADGFKLYECFMDGAFSPTCGGRDGIGKTKAGKGVKIMMAVDAQALFGFMAAGEFPERMVGDKAYDSDKLDEKFALMGMEMIAPHRSNRKPESKSQDGQEASFDSIITENTSIVIAFLFFTGKSTMDMPQLEHSPYSWNTFKYLRRMLYSPLVIFSQL